MTIDAKNFSIIFFAHFCCGSCRYFYLVCIKKKRKKSQFAHLNVFYCHFFLLKNIFFKHTLPVISIIIMKNIIEGHDFSFV